MCCDVYLPVFLHSNPLPSTSTPLLFHIICHASTYLHSKKELKQMIFLFFSAKKLKIS